MILVTGGTGLVGAHLLLQLLQENEAVRAVFRHSSSIAKTKKLFIIENKAGLFDKIEWIEADITDIPALEKAFVNVTQLYHCAALVSFDTQDEEQLRKTNIEGTANVVNCCIDFNVKKICYVSSIAALGDAKEGENSITETTEWNPEKNHSDYALTKYGAETEVWRAAQEGLEVIIVNPGIIFGNGFGATGSGLLLQKIQNGLAFYTRGTAGITTVDDVVAIMIQLMKSPISGERFAIVSENISYRDLLNILADAMQKKRPYLYARPYMTSLLWRMDWLFSKLFFTRQRFTRDMFKSAHSTETYDNFKIKNQLNYDFQPIKSYLTTVSQAYRKTR